MRKNKFLLVFVTLLVAGCAKSPTITDMSQNEELIFREMTVYMKGENNTPPSYITISPVEGVDCKRNLYSSEDATSSKAYESMKVVAAKHGATAIVNVECVDQGTSWSKNCWQTQVCSGIAIKYK